MKFKKFTRKGRRRRKEAPVIQIDGTKQVDLLPLLATPDETDLTSRESSVRVLTETLVSSPPAKTKRKSSQKFIRNERRRKKASIRALCGIGEIPLDLILEEPEPEKLDNLLKSKFGLFIYSVCLAAIASQRFWLLHAITLVILGLVFERTVSWGLFFRGSWEFQEFKRLSCWLIRFGLDEAEKTLHGDGLRQWLAGFSLQVWNRVGKSYFYALMRQQYKDINSRVLKETKGAMDRNQRTHLLFERSNQMQHILLERSRELQQQIFDRSSMIQQQVAQRTKQAQ